MGALKSSHRENRTAIQPLSTLNPTRVPGITRGILWTSRDRKSPVLHPPARKLNRNFRFTAPRQSNRKRTLGTRRETNPTAKPITWQAFKDHMETSCQLPVDYTEDTLIDFIESTLLYLQHFMMSRFVAKQRPIKYRFSNFPIFRYCSFGWEQDIHYCFPINVCAKYLQWLLWDLQYFRRYKNVLWDVAPFRLLVFRSIKEFNLHLFLFEVFFVDVVELLWWKIILEIYVSDN